MYIYIYMHVNMCHGKLQIPSKVQLDLLEIYIISLSKLLYMSIDITQTEKA